MAKRSRKAAGTANVVFGISAVVQFGAAVLPGKDDGDKRTAAERAAASGRFVAEKAQFPVAEVEWPSCENREPNLRSEWTSRDVGG